MSKEKYSIAIETTCRKGGVALGVGDRLLEARDLGPGGRHAAGLPVALEEMVRAHRIDPGSIDELYVSVGPGSYTGIRVGIAFARTLGQVIPDLNLVPVPTALAVAENITSRNWRRLGVLLAARENVPWGILLERHDAGPPKIAEEPKVAPVEDLVENWGTPLVLTGEGLGYCDFSDIEGVEIIPEEDRFPAVQSVWFAGRRLAKCGKYVNFCELLPLYARRPEAVRLWEQRKDESPSA